METARVRPQGVGFVSVKRVFPFSSSPDPCRRFDPARRLTTCVPATMAPNPLHLIGGHVVPELLVGLIILRSRLASFLRTISVWSPVQVVLSVMRRLSFMIASNIIARIANMFATNSLHYKSTCCGHVKFNPLRMSADVNPYCKKLLFWVSRCVMAFVRARSKGARLQMTSVRCCRPNYSTFLSKTTESRSQLKSLSMSSKEMQAPVLLSTALHPEESILA